MVVRAWPGGQQADFVAYYGAGSSYVYPVGVTSASGCRHLHNVAADSAEGACRHLRSRHEPCRLRRQFRELWDYFQVCTFKASASAIRHGRTVRLSGKVPAYSGKVIVYSRTRAAGQPSTTAAKGWVKVGTYTVKSGKFATVCCTRGALRGTWSGTLESASRLSPR